MRSPILSLYGWSLYSLRIDQLLNITKLFIPYRTIHILSILSHIVLMHFTQQFKWVIFIWIGVYINHSVFYLIFNEMANLTSFSASFGFGVSLLFRAAKLVLTKPKLFFSCLISISISISKQLPKFAFVSNCLLTKLKSIIYLFLFPHQIK